MYMYDGDGQSLLLWVSGLHDTSTTKLVDERTVHPHPPHRLQGYCAHAKQPPPPSATRGPSVQSYCRVLGGGDGQSLLVSFSGLHDTFAAKLVDDRSVHPHPPHRSLEPAHLST